MQNLPYIGSNNIKIKLKRKENESPYSPIHVTHWLNSPSSDGFIIILFIFW